MEEDVAGRSIRSFAEFHEKRNKLPPDDQARVVQLMQELRPDMRLESPHDPRIAEKRMHQRIHALGYVGEALVDALQSGLACAIAVGYEQMYRAGHRGTDDPMGRQLHPVRDAVALNQIPDIAIIAAAGHLLRAVLTMANPEADSAAEVAMYEPVLDDRMQYFRDVREDLSGALIHLDSLSRRILPELPAYLDRYDALFTELRQAQGATVEPEGDDPSEPEEAPESVSRIPRSHLDAAIAQVVERIRSTHPDAEIEVEVVAVPPRSLLHYAQSHQEPTEDDSTESEGEDS